MKINIFLQDNLKALGERCPQTAAWLAAANPDPDALYERIFINSFGMMDWKMNDGRGIYSLAPPQALYKEWRPSGKVEGGATVIVGAGLGYGLNHVLSGSPNSHKVFVLEPRPDMLLACLGQTEYRAFMEIGKLRFLPPDVGLLEQSLQELDVSFLFSKINLRSDLALKQLGPEYDRWSVTARQKLEALAVELSTLRYKQETMVDHELDNFGRAMRDGSLLQLEGAARGLSVAVLGAGPSLARFAPDLARDRGTALYVSALQTLPALERLGLKPDLCLGLDFNPEMRNSVDNLRDKNFAADVPLIYSTKMDPEVLALYPGPTIPLWTMGGVATFILSGQELVLDAGGNVGVTLERLLTWCGASRFVLVGQDYSWKGAITHVDGHHAAKGERPFDPSRDVAMKNLDGETIYSAMGYLVAKRDMEKDIAASRLPFHNLYGGGVPIAGAENVSLEDVRARGLLQSSPGSKRRFLDALRRANSPRVRPVFMPRAGEWRSSLRNAEKRLEKLFKKPERHQGEIRGMLANLQLFLKQDPLYLPYLYNEVMDVAGLLRARSRYELKDMTTLREVKRRVLSKVRRVDERLAAPPGNAAA